MHINMENFDKSERSTSEIVKEAQYWCAIADEIAHRGGPRSYINLMMNLAAGSARGTPHFGVRSLWESTANRVEEAENEASKYGYRRDVSEELITGYEKIIEGYRGSRDYLWYRYCENSDFDPCSSDREWFACRIKEHKKRIQELEEHLKNEIVGD